MGNTRFGWTRVPKHGQISAPIMIMLTLAVGVAASAVGAAQQSSFDRLPPDVLDVVPPSERVTGAPGDMTIQPTTCRSVPMAEVRRRIVDVAVQEWAYFGFSVVDQTAIEPTGPVRRRGRRRRPRRSAEESARVADTIAGYWTVTPEGGWILDAQNEAWAGPSGISARWRYPWSAAFISWVMCEGGLGDSSQFQRAVAHHVYIDQAIRARAADAPAAAYEAHDIGQVPMAPGDLLCSARRPAYRSIADRRRQMGDGARTHCDVVVKLDASHSRILAIGGNVRGTVSLKLLPAVSVPGEHLRPVAGARRMFAHLKLRADPIAENALDYSPTLKALVCADPDPTPAWRAAANLLAGSIAGC